MRFAMQRAVLGFVAAALLIAAAAPPASSFDIMIGEAKAQMLVDPTKAGERAVEARRIAEREPDGIARETHIATAEWLQAEASVRINDIARAKPLINDALRRIGTSRPSKLLGDLLMARGGVHSAQADVAAALVDYQRAHNIFRDAGETRSQSIALVTIGSLYQNADDNENALKYYSLALDAYHGDPALELSILNNRGGALQDLARYSDALDQFGRALAIARQLKSVQFEAQIYRNIARVQIEQRALDDASRTIARGMLVSAAQAEAARPQFDAIAAEVALRRGKLGLARELIERSFAGVDIATTGPASREAHYTAYEIYSRLNDGTDALAHLQAMKRLDDQVWKLTSSTNTALMAARFDSANQEARIAKLKADDAARQLAMAQAETRFQRILFTSIAAAALVVLGLLGFGLIQSRRARVRLSASNTALAKALAAKTEFLATTSHEIRTPLNGILGMTQVMLADPRLDAKLKDRVGIVQEAGFTMRSLVDDILDVAKMETGNLTVEALPFDLKAMLEDVTRMWAEQARAKGLDFRLELVDCPRGLLGDAGRVRQVVYNLLSNAVKFTAIGHVTVRVACAGDRLRIVVSDSGIGIAPDKHEEIFESFKQADGGTTRQFGGTGLGLTIVKNIVAALDGSVSVDSAIDAGATFTVDLPFIAAKLSRPETPTHGEGGGLLIVDKNPIARAMLKAVLEPRAGSVVFAGSCAEAIEMLGRGGIARVLVDEATARADDSDPTTAIATVVAATPVPIAVLWPTPDDAVRTALIQSGVVQVIAKPIAGPALASALYACNTEEPIVTEAA